METRNALIRMAQETAARLPDEALLRAEKARRSLHEFVRQSWHVFDPATTFVDNWHVGAICEHLEAVTRAEIRDLIINIPPGHAKSLIFAVAWPAWVWASRPTWQAIFASYAASLSWRDSRRCRSLIESPWYQERFARDPSTREAWALSADHNTQGDFANTRAGRRLAVGFDGSITGERGDGIACDDPHNVTEINSKASRDHVGEIWTQTMPSRLNHLETGFRVLMGQRSHDDDIFGRMLRAGGYVHLRLPSEFDPKRRSITHARKVTRTAGEPTVDRDAAGNEIRRELFRDPRVEPGELLFPKMFPQRALDDLKKPTALGARGFGAQYNQDPDADGGNMFRRSFWRFWKPDGVAASAVPRPEGCYEGPAVPLPPHLVEILSLDAAFRDGKKNDRVAFGRLGIWRANFYVLNVACERMDFTKTQETMLAWAKMFPRARKKYVEGKANGDAIVNSLKTRVGGMVVVEPEGGKESRASAMQPYVQSGNVYLPEGAPWLEDFVDEFAKFPHGSHDDQVDMLSQAINAEGPTPDAQRSIDMVSGL